MRIAIFGATSQIAKDLIIQFAAQKTHELALFSRKPEEVKNWLKNINLTNLYPCCFFDDLQTNEPFNAIINFVGVGDPLKAVAMGSSIFDVTMQYDELSISYLKKNPSCRYIFLSSGAAYGSSFEAPADIKTNAVININNLKAHDWYSVSKIYTECRHRSLSHMPIVDIRVFNYFSHTMDINAQYLITAIVRAIVNNEVFKTTKDSIVRDFISPNDFFQLINLILNSSEKNMVVDCYSKAPIDKLVLLKILDREFGLKYEFNDINNTFNSAISKKYYFSLHKEASKFGYKPTLSSEKNIIQEIKLFLNTNGNSI